MLLKLYKAQPRSKVSSVEDLRTGGCWFEPLARPIFFPVIDDSHCNRINSSFTAVHCLDDGYVRKQPVTCKEYFPNYRLKELQESMHRHTATSM